MNVAVLRRYPLDQLPSTARGSLILLVLLAFGRLWEIPGHADVSFPNPLPPALAEGEFLLGELNCTACHRADDAVLNRLRSNSGPTLGTNGLRLNPTWLKSWVLHPHATKAGTRMPELLTAFEPNQQTEIAEALVQFLVSRQAPGESEGAEADAALMARGEQLYQTIGCIACHAPMKAAPDGGQEALDRATKESVPLGSLAAKYPAAELARFLQNPTAHRPGGRMPQMNLTSDEALALATYLVREQGSTGSNGVEGLVPGLKVKYYEGSFGRCADISAAVPKSVGVSGGIPEKLPERANDYGLILTGVLDVRTGGKYTFWTTSDDGSTIQVDDKLVVNNDGTHAPRERTGEIDLNAGLHPFELRFFQGGGGAELQLAWAGPGFTRQPIPKFALKRNGTLMHPIGYVPLALNPEKVTLGQRYYSQLRCAACHRMDDSSPGALGFEPSKPLKQLGARVQNGCLAETPPPGVPQFGLSKPQRDALRKTLAELSALESAQSPAAELESRLARLNCYACHQRAGIGGPDLHGKTPWFSVVGDADLGEEGRIPPHLNGVGSKLRLLWLETLLHNGTKVRPYMATRMPVFGDSSTRDLPALIRAVDHRTHALEEPTGSDRESKIGQKLVGRDGLSCVSCHTFGSFASLGIPALGLERMHERLEYDWFRRYLPDPAALRPGTRMPSFWPDGKAVNTALLGGDTDAQIRAIWAWMRGGAKAEIPTGLIRGRKEIVVGDEAVIYRNFVDGAGPRAIAVGYPEHASLAFDANSLRLAMIWQGSFMDAARHSTDRGTGFEPPLGDHIYRFPEGDAFAALAHANDPWPVPQHRTARGRFLGYQLDSKQRPIFRYQVDGVTIEDYPTAKSDGVDATIVRTIHFKGKPTNGKLWFRAAVGDLRGSGGADFEVDDHVHIHFSEHQVFQLMGRELRIEVPESGELIEEISW